MAPGLFAPLADENPGTAAQWLLSDFAEGSDTYDLAVLRYLSRTSVQEALSHPSFLSVAIEGGLTSAHADVRAQAAALAEALMAQGAPAEALPEAAWFHETPGIAADIRPTADRIRANISRSGPGTRPLR